METSINRLHTPAELDAEAFVAEVKRFRDRRNPLTGAALRSLREEYTWTVERARKLAAERAALSAGSAAYSQSLRHRLGS